MSFAKSTKRNRMRKTGKRVLIGETREEEAARLENEIAAHPITRCEPGSVRLPHRDRVGVASHSFRSQSG